MTKSSLLLLLALVPAIGIAATAGADREQRREGMREKAEARFAEADRNRDGKLSLAEWQDAQDRKLAERFQKLDTNADGALTAEEMQQARQQHRHQRSAKRHQGQAMRHHLQALDSNQDKQLSRAELGDKAPRLSENFERIDSNRDGQLSMEEMRAAGKAMRGTQAR